MEALANPSRPDSEISNNHRFHIVLPSLPGLRRRLDRAFGTDRLQRLVELLGAQLR